MDEVVALLAGGVQCKNCSYFSRNARRWGGDNICYKRANITKKGRFAERSKNMWRMCPHWKEADQKKPF